MKWIKITDNNLPPFNLRVIITDEEFNRIEREFITAIQILKGIWEDETGREPKWEDVNNSGITNPTHYCIIPKLNNKT